MPHRTRYRFTHRAAGRYFWEAVLYQDGATVVTERVSCFVTWFWSVPPRPERTEGSTR